MAVLARRFTAGELIKGLSDDPEDQFTEHKWREDRMVKNTTLLFFATVIPFIITQPASVTR